MKLRTALKKYHRSKPTILKARWISEEGFVIGTGGRSFWQDYPRSNKAYTTIVRYLKKNPKVHHVGDGGRYCNFDIQLKTEYFNPKFLKNNLPEVGVILPSYDDGKLTESREQRVKVEEIIPFNEASEGWHIAWNWDIREHPWIFATTTDYFIVCSTVDKWPNEDPNDRVWFARTIEGGWFSLGNDWRNGTGCLDTTGELYNLVHKKENKNT